MGRFPAVKKLVETLDSYIPGAPSVPIDSRS